MNDFEENKNEPFLGVLVWDEKNGWRIINVFNEQKKSKCFFIRSED
jgi:hypothetical protein